MMSAPCSAKPLAIAKPIPVLAPVTKAVFPVKSKKLLVMHPQLSKAFT
jgi:hypothetical protein